MRHPNNGDNYLDFHRSCSSIYRDFFIASPSPAGASEAPLLHFPAVLENWDINSQRILRR
jgi:hypothetical protein